MRKIYLLLLSFMISFNMMAQLNYKITVIDQNNGQLVPNASIMIKGSNKGAITNMNGVADIQTDKQTAVEISAIGYKTVVIKLDKKNELTVTLENSTTEMEVVTVGSRGSARAKTETAVPVDVIKVNQTGLPTARTDLTSILNFAAPSFNYNKQTGADGADHIDLGTLRGLGPDQTLVLINGKRRHNTAFVALFGTRGRGNSGTDLNAFAQSSVDRIEILRDGASAQYGSDAMAGVMNIILKKDVNKWNVNVGWAGHYDNKYNSYLTRANNQYYYSKPIDGGTFTFSANTGFKLNDHGGFINLSFDYLNQAKTFRQVGDTNVQSNPKALPLNAFRRAFGDGSVSTRGAMFNMELPGKNKKSTFYAFGGINRKASDAYAYTRNFSWNPQRFPIDANGNLVYDNEIMRTSSDGEIYYNPHIQTIISDASIAAGFKGKNAHNWSWDFSNTLGQNDFHYYGDKTFNASIIPILGAERPTHFDDGGFNFLQNTTNLDFSKSFSSIANGLNIGIGVEFRYERYQIYKGEESSYKTYPNAYGQAGGSQGFPGFSPLDEVKAQRSNLSFYVDAELKATKKWLLDAAVRAENYSDFGSLATFKLATSYKVSNNFNLRASASSGFRAPSLQQINFSNTLTSYYGNELVQSRIANNNDLITKTAGIEKLKQETSINSSAGFAWKPMTGLTITLDGYMVQVKNRIVLSGLFSASDTVGSPNNPALPAALTSQMAALNVQTVQFFSNSVNTTNYGIDLVVDYSKKIGNNTLKMMLAGNFQKMKVDKVNVPAQLNDSYRHRKTFFSDREEAFLLASAPQAKANLNIEYAMKKLSFGTHINYFGKMKSLGFGWTGLASAAGTGGPGDPAISGSFTGIDPYVDIDGYSDGINVVKEEFLYRGKVTVDLFASYKIGKKITWFIGCDNILNAHPDFAAVQRARYESYDNEAGGAWESVQMGYNGRRLFSKIAFNF